MKKNLILLFTPLVLLLIMLSAGYSLKGPADDNEEMATIDAVPVSHFTTKATTANKSVAKRPKDYNWISKGETYKVPASASEKAGTLITYAMGLIGSPYVYGGTTPEGFDCSGFIKHVFDRHDITVSRSSSTQSNDGIPVDRTDAAPGDLVIFTGTNSSVREPGHVGIVISEPGDTITFVHSSSNGGVKVSKVEGTGYDRRFLEIRRVM